MTAAGETGSAAPPRRSGGARPFVVNVRALRSGTTGRHAGTHVPTSSRLEVHLSGPLSGLSVSSAGVPDGSVVTFDGWVEAALGGVTLAGEVSAPWSGVCRRCLGEASGTLRAEVREFCRDPELLGGGGFGGGGASDDELSDYLVGPDTLDVEPVAHDACILELPLAPLCSESCRGLCPICGANLNFEACSCERPTDPRWAALAGLHQGEVAKEAALEEDAGDGGLEQPQPPGPYDPDDLAE